MIARPSTKMNHVLMPLILTLIVPAFILMKFSDESHLGAWNAFFLALAFPLLYAAFELVQSSQVHWISILGLINVLITGGFGLMQLEGIWFALKEGSIPFIMGTFMLISTQWKQPLLHRLLMNPKIFNVELIREGITAQHSEQAFNRLLTKMSLIIAASFFVSSVLNFGLAYFLLKSPAGTSAFNKEFAHMQLLSYPVIAVPSLLVASGALIMFLRSLPTLTGHAFTDIFVSK